MSGTEINPILHEQDLITELRLRSLIQINYWSEHLPYWLLAETCLALANRVEELEDKWALHKKS